MTITISCNLLDHKWKVLKMAISLDISHLTLDIYSAYSEFSVRLTNVLNECAPFESIIKDNIQEHLQANNVIPP